MSRASFRQNLKGRALSFKYAWEGIRTAFRDEPNLKIHFVLAGMAFFLGFIAKITLVQWTILVFVITLMISMELINTSLESIVNHFTLDQDPNAKFAKDVSAGAVLIAALGAVVIGAIIFLPYFFR